MIRLARLLARLLTPARLLGPVKRLELGNRTIFVASKKKRTKEVVHDKYIERLDLQKEADYHRKIKEIRSLTAKVSRIVQKKEDQRKKLREISKIPLPSDMEKETDEIYQALESGPKGLGPSLLETKSGLDQNLLESVLVPGLVPGPNGPVSSPSAFSLISPIINLPPPIEERLGLSVKFLISETHQNWPLIIQSLKMSGGFKDLNPKDVRKFIYNIPKTHLKSIIPEIQALLKEAKITTTKSVINTFIESLSLGKTITPETLHTIENHVTRIRKFSKKGILPKATYEIMIKVYGKVGDIDKINSFLGEMKQNDLQVSPMVYNNVLKTLVYKSRNHKEAVAVFDTMTFLSVETKPGTDAYKDIIVSYVNNTEVEKALDLYQEMLISKTPVNQEILVALARGCSTSKTLRFKAWEFIFDIYANNWTPTLETLEYVLYLAARDGDVAMARALFKRLCSIGATSRRSFTFLLMSYSKKTDEPFSILYHDKGKNFRLNLITQSLAQSLTSQPPKYQVPLLPLEDLTTPEQIMAESSAVWAHCLAFSPEFIHTDAYNTYLNIAAEVGKFGEFKERYGFSKLIEDPGINKTRVVIEEPEEPEDLEDPQGPEVAETSSPALTTSPLLDMIKNQPKITRTTLTYVIALKTAGKFRNYKFAQEVWQERGKFRKSQEFKNLPIAQKDKYDFQFANEMVQALTKMGLYDDALSIILSTEYQFSWSWAQLTPLYELCVKIGKEKATQSLRGIAKRAQIRFQGKIRRKDYKEYRLKRGY